MTVNLSSSQLVISNSLPISVACSHQIIHYPFCKASFSRQLPNVQGLSWQQVMTSIVITTPYLYSMAWGKEVSQAGRRVQSVRQP